MMLSYKEDNGSSSLEGQGLATTVVKKVMVKIMQRNTFSWTSWHNITYQFQRHPNKAHQ